MNFLFDKYCPRFISDAVAAMAELVDALGSGSSGHMPVRVRLPLAANFLLLTSPIILHKSCSNSSIIPIIKQEHSYISENSENRMLKSF